LPNVPTFILKVKGQSVQWVRTAAFHVGIFACLYYIL